MSALLLAVMVAAAPASSSPPAAPSPAAPAPVAAPAPAAAAIPSALAAPAPAASPGASSFDFAPASAAHASTGLLQGPAVAVVLVTGLAVAGLLLMRRRTRSPRFVQVLETASLGPKRSLVVARLGDELLLLGSSEAGIHVLSTQAAGEEARAAGEPAPARFPAPAPAPAPSAPGAGILARLQLRRRPAADPFDALLNESVEDQELRRKLARGQTGSVR